MGKKIAFWGAGAIGGTIAAYLAEKGHELLLVDANKPHVEAINSGGLFVVSRESILTVRAKACLPEDVEGPLDWVFLAVKANRTEMAARQIRPLLAADGAIISLQNGLNEPVIASIVGAERTIGAFINFGADFIEPGKLQFGTRAAVVIGEIDGSKRQRTAEIVDLLRVFEPKTVLTDNIYGYLWSKTAYGALLKAEAVSDKTIGDFIADPDLREFNLRLVREILEVARAEGIAPLPFDGFEPDLFLSDDLAAANACLDRVATFWAVSDKPYSSPWRDIAILKMRTDAPEQLEPVFAVAEKHGLPVPLNRKVISLIREVEDGKKSQGPATVQELLSVMRAA